MKNLIFFYVISQFKVKVLVIYNYNIHKTNTDVCEITTDTFELKKQLKTTK